MKGEYQFPEVGSNQMFIGGGYFYKISGSSN